MAMTSDCPPQKNCKTPGISPRDSTILQMQQLSKTKKQQVGYKTEAALETKFTKKESEQSHTNCETLLGTVQSSKCSDYRNQKTNRWGPKPRRNSQKERSKTQKSLRLRNCATPRNSKNGCNLGLSATQTANSWEPRNHLGTKTQFPTKRGQQKNREPTETQNQMRSHCTTKASCAPGTRDFARERTRRQGEGEHCGSNESDGRGGGLYRGWMSAQEQLQTDANSGEVEVVRSSRNCRDRWWAATDEWADEQHRKLGNSLPRFLLSSLRDAGEGSGLRRRGVNTASWGTHVSLPAWLLFFYFPCFFFFDTNEHC